MSRLPKNLNVPMAVLTIGYRQFVLPSAKAIKVAELMQDAVEVEYDYRESSRKYLVQSQDLKIAFELVRADQLVMPEGVVEPTPAPRAAQRQLRSTPRRLSQ